MEKNELEIPYFNKDKEKEKNLGVVKQEEQESKTLITQVFDRAKMAVIENDDVIKDEILQNAKRDIKTEVQTLSTQTSIKNKNANYERNKEACKLFGFKDDSNVENWQQRLMVWGYNFWFCIYYALAFPTIAPITFLFSKIQGCIKQTWLSISLAIIVYILVSIGIPIIIANINN